MVWKIVLGIILVLVIWASFISDGITKEWRRQASVALDEIARRWQRRKEERH
jgi:hypothetical protein